MDKLLNEFTVRRPIEATWQILTDLERIAPCMPGAQLEEIAGDEYRGVVKVKLGAIQAAFKGQASFVERDDDNHTATLKAAGRDTGGKGNADALITARLEPHGDDTTCIVETDLRITGKVAQFGRSIMADVSKKLMAQFAQNLNDMIEADGSSATSTAATSERAETPAEATPVEATPAGNTAAPAGNTAAAAGAEPAADAPTIRKIDGPAADPIELSGLAGGPILKRLLPLVGGVAVVLLVLRRRCRR